jgi:hypothetical protein
VIAVAAPIDRAAGAVRLDPGGRSTHAVTWQVDQLDVYKRFRPRAYAYLIRTDDLALKLAQMNGWIEAERPTGRTAEEITHAERVTRDAIAAISEANRVRPPISNSPRNIDEARDEAARAHAATVAAAARKPATLEAVRAANPLIAKTRALPGATWEAKTRATSPNASHPHHHASI